MSQCDLLDMEGRTPPLGDLYMKPKIAECRSLWVEPLPQEDGAPPERIIHAMIGRFHGPVRLDDLVIRTAHGYHKCGSEYIEDKVTAVRVRARVEGSWTDVRYVAGLPEYESETLVPLGGVIADAVIIEARKCEVDQWFTPWNLVTGAFTLLGELLHPQSDAEENLLEVKSIALGEPSHAEVEVFEAQGAVHYRTEHYEVALAKSRPAMTHLSFQSNDLSSPPPNLLFLAAGSMPNSPVVCLVGKPQAAAAMVRFTAEGSSAFSGSSAEYRCVFPDVGHELLLRWEFGVDSFSFSWKCSIAEEVEAWEFSPWRLCFRPSTSAVQIPGRVVGRGWTGELAAPVIVHSPGHGSLTVERKQTSASPPDSASQPAEIRAQVDRPADMIRVDLGWQGIPTERGTMMLQPGVHSGTLAFRPEHAVVSLMPETPDVVRRCLRRGLHTALTFRADTATLSNNGASMHCPLSAEGWSSILTQPNIEVPWGHPVELLRVSLERWLAGAPGYGSGWMKSNGTRHLAEDEYLQSGVAPLHAIADYLLYTDNTDWYSTRREDIETKCRELAGRDLDGDGLIESPYRTGISGQGHWSTSFFDVISFGWKDAYVNALLYRTLVRLSQAVSVLGDRDWGHDLADWAARLRSNYRQAFWNDTTGWIAGWRCKRGMLHDYAFLFVNGAAVVCGLLEPDEAHSVIQRLWKEMRRVECPSAHLGLPGNLWRIPQSDLTEIMHGFPFGFYQNGGRTFAQSRFFVEALFHVGMEREGEQLLKELCEGLAEGLPVGGNGSGVDWRYWDDRPSGYEGVLTDQFSFLSVALRRFALVSQSDERGASE